MTSTSRIRNFAVILAAMAVSLPAWSQSPEEVAKIEQAMPKTAVTKPAKQRKVLVYSQALGYRHASIPYAEKAFEIMGKTTGAFTVDTSSDPSALAPENLARYDALVLNNTTGEWLTTPTLRQGLLDFVGSGKGLMGIHAASDGNFEWAEFGDLIGGYFQSHPWTSKDTVTLKVDQPDHPLTRAFKGKSLEVNDEIYQIRDPYSRDKVLELVSLDTDKTDMNKKGITRTDGDFPVSWVRSFKQGRVFYTSLGHNTHIYWNPTVLQHYLDGLQFALGDLDAPSKPAGSKAADKPTTAPAEAVGDDGQMTGTETKISKEALTAALSELDSYDFGKERGFLLTIDAAIREKGRAGKGKDQELAGALVEKAVNPKLTYAARDLALRRLAGIGKPQHVKALSPLLADKDAKLADSARRAVAAIPGEKASAALVEALAKASGETKIGLIDSIGQRGKSGEGAVKELTRLARQGETAEINAAMTALGKIGTQSSAKALLDDVRPPDAARLTWFAALNDAAEQISDNNKKLAGRVYDRVLQMGANTPAQLAAFRGKAMLDGHPEATALKALDDGAAGVEQVARQILVRGDDPDVARQLMDRLHNGTVEKKVVVVQILGARKDKAALEEITTLATQSAPESAALQVAALRALQHLGDQRTVPMLLKVAAEGKGEAASAAAETLVEMRVAEVDPELLKAINGAPSPAEQAAAIDAVVSRKVEGAVDPLLQAAASPQDKVAVAAFKALSQLGSADDLGKVLKLHDSLRNAKVIKEAGRTIAALAKASKKPGDVSKDIQGAYASASDEAIKASLLGVMGKIGGETSLKTLKDTASSGDEKLKDAAVRALAEFPDTTALEPLMAISSGDSTQVHKVLALRGVARLLSQDDGGNGAERLAMAKIALDLAPGPDEKKAVIGAVAELKSTGVLELIMPLLEQADLREETVAAIIKQAPIANQIDPGATAELLNPLSKKLDQDNWNKLEEVLTPADGGAGAIRAFEISDKYALGDDAKAPELASTPFEPETSGGKWTGIVWAGIDEQGDKLGRADLKAYYPGAKNVAVYLRAHVWSPEDRKAELRTGSDDGMRAWLNGEQIFTHDATRGFAWDADKTKIDLKRGWNTLLLKVAQGGGDWSVAARLLNPDGKPMSDLKYSALPQGR